MWEGPWCPDVCATVSTFGMVWDRGIKAPPTLLRFNSGYVRSSRSEFEVIVRFVSADPEPVILRAMYAANLSALQESALSPRFYRNSAQRLSCAGAAIKRNAVRNATYL